jgi:class 3 adenylate cyclase
MRFPSAANNATSPKKSPRETGPAVGIVARAEVSRYTDDGIETAYSALAARRDRVNADQGSSDSFVIVDTDRGALVYAVPPVACLAAEADASEAICGVTAVAESAFFRRSIGEEEVRVGGETYAVSYRFVAACNCVVGTMSAKDEPLHRSGQNLGIMIGVAAVIIIVVAFAVHLLTAHALRRIELEYVEYKTQIENEKVQFSELVKDVMPSFISARIMGGEKLIVDSHPMLTFLFSDIVGCGDLVRHMSTVEMVRLLGYTFMVQDAVAEYYSIHKLKTIGDAFFCVSGLEDLKFKRDAEARKKVESDASPTDNGIVIDEAKAKDNQVLRMVSFAVVTQQLLGTDYVHYPERTECFLESAGRDLGRLDMVSMQMGIHCGPAIAGVVDVGRAPHFDCFGASVNLASRMETTAPVDRLQISAPTHDLLKNVDKKQEFQWDPPKRTLVKGYGTLNTYVIKSTTLRVPEDILNRLHVDRAVRLRYFTETGLLTNELEAQKHEDESSVSMHSSITQQ